MLPACWKNSWCFTAHCHLLFLLPLARLRLFQKFSTFRILVCGGDGSVGWVLSEIDSLGLHKQVKAAPQSPTPSRVKSWATHSASWLLSLYLECLHARTHARTHTLS